MPTLDALLLDLDGTLADTAADLGGALNDLLAEEGRPAMAAEAIRPVASDGARGLLKLGFGIDRGDDGFDDLRTRFLDGYTRRVARETRVFDGMRELLAELARHDIPWGLVTNKPGWLTAPLMEALAIEPPAGCVVSGDTLDQAKPHPAPLHHAAELLAAEPARCVYVGDAPRDIDAAVAAGMIPVVAGWGYLPADTNGARWGAAAVAETPAALRDWLLAHLEGASADVG